VVMPLMKPADPRESVLRAAGFVQFGLLAGGLAVTVAAALAPLLIKVFFGARFLPSVRAAQILLFAAVFQGLNSVLGNALRNLGHPGKPAAGEVLGMAATVGLLAVLLPRYGILGAAAASLIAYTLVFLALLRFLAGIAGVPLTELVAPARLLKVANARESPVPSGDQRAE
jgi:O-antigen/teichoic acid export membrane protein